MSKPNPLNPSTNNRTLAKHYLNARDDTHYTMHKVQPLLLH
jgi:hypothetical protein